MLSALVERFGGELREGAGRPIDVRGVALDSRAVNAGDLYVAVPGRTTDGARFAESAIERGARAVLAPRASEALARASSSTGAPLWLHPDARALAGRVAAELQGHPSRALFVACVTGTNGKTTVATLVHQLWTNRGRRSGVLGTVGNVLADGRVVPATHTTPDGPGLQRLLADHVRAGGDSIVLEVSSHALDQDRIAGLEIDVAVFTNLGRDHLDYHGSIEHYARAKARLFAALDADASAVIHADDDHASVMIEAARRSGARIVTYSIAKDADLRAERLVCDLQGTHLTLSGMGFSGVELRLPLIGRHNVANALAASGAVLMSGASPSAIAEGLAAVSLPPGRLERVSFDGAKPAVFVDYAHTPDALASALDALREALPAGGRSIVVFGCGGERDRGKRPLMGAAAAERADRVLVTSDNPRGEDPAAICAEVAGGAADGRAETTVVVDRRTAIRRAIEAAGPCDVVLVAGKGHETEQVIGGERIPFDDRAVALEELG